MTEVLIGFSWGLLLGVVIGIGIGMYYQYKQRN